MAGSKSAFINIHLMNINILRNICLYFAIFFSCSVLAFKSNITNVDQNSLAAQFKVGVDFDNLYIRAANNQGISYNEFTSFEQYNKPLNIINNPVINPLLKGTTQAPKVIILHSKSKSPLVLGEINIIGKGAELIIISESGIQCKSCEINNSSRIVLTTGRPIFDDGQLTSFVVTKGSIDINSVQNGRGLKEGLITNGASIIDLIADDIRINGEINTQLSATKTPQGKLTVDDSGTLSIATGNLQLIAGHNTFDFINGGIAINPTNSSRQLSGEITISAPIYTGGLYIESTGNNSSVNVSEAIVTTADLTLASIYKSYTILPSDIITIKSFGNITLFDKLLSGNAVNLESGNDILIHQKRERTIPRSSEYNGATGYIDTSTINIASKAIFFSEGSLNAQNIKIAAGRINNEGDIFGRTSIYLSSETDINNVFGGMIVGDDIALNAQGKVTNGSSRPYRLVPKLQRSMERYSIIIGTEPELPNDPSYMMRESVDSLAAIILGDKIVIKATKFSNFNPYEVKRKRYEDNPAVLDDVLSDQVIVSAETMMIIDAKEAVLNSSGIIEVLNGPLTVKTTLLEQERYHIETAEHISTSGSTRLVTNFVTVLSPLSRMRLAGELNITADRIENKNSGIEVLGNVKGASKDVRMTGHLLKDFQIETTTTYHSKRYCARRVIRKCIKRRTRNWITSTEQVIEVEGNINFPFLFYVDGTLSADFGTEVQIYQEIVYGPNGKGPSQLPSKPGANSITANFAGYEDRKADLTPFFSENRNHKKTIVLSDHNAKWKTIKFKVLGDIFGDPWFYKQSTILQKIPDLIITYGKSLSSTYQELGMTLLDSKHILPLWVNDIRVVSNVIGDAWELESNYSSSFVNAVNKETNNSLIYLNQVASKEVRVAAGQTATLTATYTFKMDWGWGASSRSFADKTQSNIYELVITDLSGKKKYLNVVLGHNNKK